MFKIFKYVFFLNLYKKAKRNVLAVGGMLIFLAISTYLMNDLILVAEGTEKYLFLLIKWIIVITILLGMFYNVLKIYNKAVDSMSLKFNREEPMHNDEKKERILQKEQLRSKSDQIMDKYTSIA